MILKLLLILVITGGVAWWLSGFDSKLTWQDQTADLVRRGLRCGITLVLVGFGASMLLSGGVAGGFIFVLFALPLAVIWMSCLSEASAHLFHGLLDHSDNRQYDSRQVTRDLSRLAGLVREDRNEEAITLCQKLLESSEVSAVAMETMLLQIYEEQFADERVASQPAFAAIQRLRDQKRFAEAVAALEIMLKKDKDDLAAALFLMRIQSQDLHRSDQAKARLQTLAEHSHFPPHFADYARRRIGEWSDPLPRKEKSTEGIESLLVDSPVPAKKASDAVPDAASADQLLAAGHLATAIELLESKVREQPGDFDSWLKLAEAHGVYCRDLARAGKLVDKMAGNPAFSMEQIQMARAKLKAWRSVGMR